MELFSIPTGNLKFDGGAMFGVVPKMLWQRQYKVDENNMITGSMRCLLAVDDDRKILFDSGIGNKQNKKFFSYYYLTGEDTLEKSLAKYGFATEDITDHVLTHLHFDHCGGSIQFTRNRTKFIPSFPNAIYWISTMQWEHALKPNKLEGASFLEENILPIRDSGKLMLFDKEFNLTKNIRIMLFDGHTRGQAVALISYKGRTVVNISDLIPMAGNISMSWISGYDTMPLVSLEEKEKFLEKSVKNDYIYFFYHDPKWECCTLKRTEKGIRPDKAMKLAEIRELS